MFRAHPALAVGCGKSTPVDDEMRVQVEAVIREFYRMDRDHDGKVCKEAVRIPEPRAWRRAH